MITKQTYYLKPAFAARALAEASVLLILSFAPLVLLLNKQLFMIHPILRWGICLLSPLSIYLLFLLCRVPYQVTLTEEALNLRSLSKLNAVKWEEIIACRQISRVGFREYLLSLKNSQISFPSLLNKSDELARSIRARIKGGGRSKSGDTQTYDLPLLAFFFDLAKGFLQFLFALLFFWFFDSLLKTSTTSKEDLYLVLCAALSIACAVAWKFCQLFRLPHKIVIDSAEIKMQNPFFKTSVSWTAIVSLSPAGIFFPDGVLLKAGKKTYLIGANMDAFDELIEEIQSRRTSSSP